MMPFWSAYCLTAVTSELEYGPMTIEISSSCMSSSKDERGLRLGLRVLDVDFELLRVLVDRGEEVFERRLARFAVGSEGASNRQAGRRS